MNIHKFRYKVLQSMLGIIVFTITYLNSYLKGEVNICKFDAAWKSSVE